MKTLVFILLSNLSIDHSEIYTTVLNFFGKEYIVPDRLHRFSMNLLDTTFIDSSNSAYLCLKKNLGTECPFKVDNKRYGISLTNLEELEGIKSPFKQDISKLNFKAKMVTYPVNREGRIKGRNKTPLFYLSPIIKTKVKDEYLVLMTRDVGNEVVWYAFLVKEQEKTYKVIGEQEWEFVNRY